MASIADMLVGSVMQSSQKGPDLVRATESGAKIGTAIAETIENVQKNREELEQKKQALQMQKANAITETIKLAHDSKDPRMQQFLLKKVVPSKVKALGMEEFFTPESLELIQTSPLARDKLRGLELDLTNKIQTGELTAAQAYGIAQKTLNDPEQLAALNTDRFYEAQKFRNEETGKTMRNREQAQASLGKQVQAQQVAGDVELKKQTAKEFADYAAAGGKATLEKNLSKLESAAKKLESGKIQTATVSTAIPGLSSDMAQDVLNPEMAAVRDDIRGAIQGTLRQTLGSQFTAQEGEAIFNRAFNPRATPEENARRLRAEIEALKATISNKENQFVSQGLMPQPKAKEEKSGGGWKGVIKAQKPALDKLPEPKKKAFIEGLSKKLNIPIEEIAKELGQ